MIQLTEAAFHGLQPNALIETNHGRFLRGDDDTWTEIFPHCIDCMQVVRDVGFDVVSMFDTGPNVSQRAWLYFTEIKILAIPLTIVSEEWKK